MFQTNAVETIKTHILCLIKFFWKSCLYEIMWENVVQTDRQTDRQTTDSNTIQRMRIACCIPKATYTNSACINTYCFCTRTMVTRTRLNVLFGLTLLSVEPRVTSWFARGSGFGRRPSLGEPEVPTIGVHVATLELHLLCRGPSRRRFAARSHRVATLSRCTMDIGKKVATARPVPCHRRQHCYVTTSTNRCTWPPSAGTQVVHAEIWRELQVRGTAFVLAALYLCLMVGAQGWRT